MATRTHRLSMSAILMSMLAVSCSAGTDAVASRESETSDGSNKGGDRARIDGDTLELTQTECSRLASSYPDRPEFTGSRSLLRQGRLPGEVMNYEARGQADGLDVRVEYDEDPEGVQYEVNDIPPGHPWGGELVVSWSRDGVVSKGFVGEVKLAAADIQEGPISRTGGTGFITDYEGGVLPKNLVEWSIDITCADTDNP